MNFISLKSKSHRTVWALPMIFFIGCASPRYGAYFNDYNRGHLPHATQITSSTTTTEIQAKGLPEPVFASANNQPLLLNDPRIHSDVEQLQVKESKQPDKPNKITVYAARQMSKKIAQRYREKENRPHGIQSTTDMPRYKYLTWTGILALLGIVLVAFSGSASVLGVLATVAFTGALVFFILWLLKK